MTKKNKSFFFGLIQSVKQTYITYTRQNFDVNQAWFDKMHQKHYTKDFDEKFNESLYEEQGVGKDILNKLLVYDDFLKGFPNEIRILSDWIKEFVNGYESLKKIIEKEEIPMNLCSPEFIQLELLYTRSQEISDQLQKYNSIFNYKITISEIDSISLIDDEGFGIPAHYSTKGIGFLKEKLSDQYSYEIVFRRLTEIIGQIRVVNKTFSKIVPKTFIIHGNGGMGKSNLSAYIFSKIKQSEKNAILLRAKSFSGESTDFNNLLLKQLEIPDNYFIDEVLKNINNYAIEYNQRIPFIIDGLNETTFANQGFSSIWKQHIDEFIQQINKYSNLYLIITLRTSYIDRIWDNKIPYHNRELLGFSNDKLDSVVEKYFKYYNIQSSELHSSDIFYFRTPLLLDLYCKMLNSKREVNVKAKLGLSGFTKVFNNYIDNLSIEIYQDLGLISKDLVRDSIDRCSREYISKNQDKIGIERYYELTDREVVKNVKNTIGYNILEGYLIYIKDSFSKKDVVFHTQQEVGGYLLAQNIIEVNNYKVEDIVNSCFFQKHLIGKQEDFHQLKDDILKFIIVFSLEQKDIIIKYTQDSSVKNLAWLKLQREPANESNIELRDQLTSVYNSKSDKNIILNNSFNSFLDLDSSLNIHFVKTITLTINKFDFELTWTKFISEKSYHFVEYLEILGDKYIEKESIIIDQQSDLDIELLIMMLESTITYIRDKATHILLEFGTQYPKYIFDRFIGYSTIVRLYTYERLAGVTYGICLRLQNDKEFVNSYLKEYAPKFYNLQFGSNPEAPSYHYIVIDSIKHIVNLAIHKGVFSLEGGDLDQLQNYYFVPNIEWNDISNEDKELVNDGVASWHNKHPDPLGKDFVTYTIPRLLVTEDGYNFEQQVEASAHIYKRTLSNGYIPKDKFKASNDVESDFYNGYHQKYVEGKVERLGKKYSWNAFFEYAGYLLNKGQLDVFYEGDTSVECHYTRLSEVELEVSFPNKVISNTEPIIETNLLVHKNESPTWTEKEMFHIAEAIFIKKDFTLLRGLVIEKPDESYDVESYLLIESFFVKKEDVLGKTGQIEGIDFGWDYGINSSSGSLTNVYFGELYWADTVPEYKFNIENLPIKVPSKESEPNDLKGLTRLEKIHECKKKKKDIQNIGVNLISTVVEYLWESKSSIYPTISEYIPLTNLGRHLGLVSDPKNLQLLDNEGKLAYKSEKFEEKGLEKQSLSYMRTDLLKKYMEDNNLTIMYQVKQHTYDRKTGDGSGDYRGMKFFFPYL